MRAKVEAVFLGLEESSFVDKKTGEVVDFRRATFNVRNTPDTFTLSVPKGVTVDRLVQYTDAFMIVDFRFNSANRTFKGHLVNVLADAKALSSAPLLSEEEAIELQKLEAK